MLTILFSTYNGMQTLPRMLEQLQVIERPDSLRIVAVDNRSNDGSLELLRHAAAVLPITIFECKDPGKNKALNFALDRIAGDLSDDDLVVVTDDDILPDTDWLIQLTNAAATRPQVDVFGGTIRPVWPTEVPQWIPQLKDAFAVLFATTSANTGLCSSHDIYGPNMAVRGKLFKDGLRFNPSIGPDGSKNFGMGSESELLRRLEREGHQLFFCEAAAVGHQIKPSLLRWSSVLARARRYGRGLGLLDAQARNSATTALRSIQRSLILELKALATLLPGLTERRIRVLFRREVERGRITSLMAPSLDLSVIMRKATRGTSPPSPVPMTNVAAANVASRPASAATAKTREAAESIES